MVRFSFKMSSFNQPVCRCGGSYTINVMFKFFLFKEISCLYKGSVCLVISYNVDIQQNSTYPNADYPDRLGPSCEYVEDSTKVIDFRSLVTKSSTVRFYGF